MYIYRFISVFHSSISMFIDFIEFIKSPNRCKLLVGSMMMLDHKSTMLEVRFWFTTHLVVDVSMFFQAVDFRIMLAAMSMGPASCSYKHMVL